MSAWLKSVALQENVPLAPYTTLGIGGPARFFVEATQESHVLEALELASASGWPLFVLGGGSNILVSDEGFPGLVLRIALRGIRTETETARHLVTVAAGEDWDIFVRRCLEQDLAGIECLSGIPGSVGGTPVQNVGAYGQEVSDVIVSVRVVERKSGTVGNLDHSDCGFSYRTSSFNGSRREQYIVLAVTFGLSPGGRPRIEYPDLKRYFSGLRGPFTLLQVRTAVLEIRARKAMLLVTNDPDCRSAGSFFKNPVVSEEMAGAIGECARRRGSLAAGEPLPRFQASSGRVKLPAAWLIEQSGFARGYCRGPAGLSSKHTLALINRGGATAKDILGLMEEIQTAVKDTFRVELSPEPVFVGF